MTISKRYTYCMFIKLSNVIAGLFYGIVFLNSYHKHISWLSHHILWIVSDTVWKLVSPDRLICSLVPYNKFFSSILMLNYLDPESYVYRSLFKIVFNYIWTIAAVLCITLDRPQQRVVKVILTKTQVFKLSLVVIAVM